MANRESKKGEKARTDIVEVHPNPHGEQTIDEAPIVQDPSTDSMFNLADPQTREILTTNSDQDRSPRQQRQRRYGRRKIA